MMLYSIFKTPASIFFSWVQFNLFVYILARSKRFMYVTTEVASLLLLSIGLKPRMLLNILQCTAFKTKTCLTPNVNHVESLCFTCSSQTIATINCLPMCSGYLQLG